MCGAGIVVFNTPGANANGVKEAVLAGMFLAARDIVGGVNWVQSVNTDPAVDKLVEKGKKQFAGTELKGKKLGVIVSVPSVSGLPMPAAFSAWKFTVMTRLFLSMPHGACPEMLNTSAIWMTFTQTAITSPFMCR